MDKFAILDVMEGFSHGGVNIGQRREPEEVGPTQVASWRGQGVGRAHKSPGRPLAPLWPIFGHLEASGTRIFYIFFLGFFGLRKIG